MTKIVGIRGEVVDGRQSRPDVVEACEKLLAEAVSGEITGFIAVKHHYDRATSNVRIGWLNYAMVGQMEQLKREMLENLE